MVVDVALLFGAAALLGSFGLGRGGLLLGLVLVSLSTGPFL